MKSVLLVVSLIWSGWIGAQSSYQLLKDIYPGDPNCNAIELTAVGDKVFFWADSMETGRELWVTDGTNSGTYMVKEIMPGEFGSAAPLFGSWMKSMIAMNGILFFCANDEDHGYELWRSDGTEEGTFLVKDIVTGSNGAFPENFMDMPYMAVMNDVLYFQAYTSQTGPELWRSDGTEEGTWLLKEIVPGVIGGEIEMLEEEGGKLYFSCRNDAGHYALWTSDGTEGGTFELGEVKLLTYDPSVSEHFVEFNGWIYFAGAYSPTFSSYDFHLWRTDGTALGTSQFMDFNLVEGSSPRGIFATSTSLFFHTSNTDNDTFYSSDGTVEGTLELFTAEGYHMTPVDNPNSTTSYVQAESVIYFPATMNDIFCLVKTNGTTAGTQPIWNTSIDTYYVEAQGRHNLTTVGDHLLYKHHDDVNDCSAVFQCNGTEQGVLAAASCLEITNPLDFVTLGNKVIVYMKDAAELFGYELYVFDLDFGTTAIELPDVTNAWKCFPNPVSTNLYIQTNGDHPCSVQVFDLLGNVVYDDVVFPKQDGILTCPMSDVANGMYVLYCTQNGQCSASKFVKE